MFLNIWVKIVKDSYKKKTPSETKFRFIGHKYMLFSPKKGCKMSLTNTWKDPYLFVIQILLLEIFFHIVILN